MPGRNPVTTPKPTLSRPAMALRLVPGRRAPFGRSARIFFDRLAEIILANTSREDFDYAHARRTATPVGLRTRTMGLLLWWMCTGCIRVITLERSRQPKYDMYRLRFTPGSYFYLAFLKYFQHCCVLGQNLCHELSQAGFARKR